MPFYRIQDSKQYYNLPDKNANITNRLDITSHNITLFNIIKTLNIFVRFLYFLVRKDKYQLSEKFKRSCCFDDDDDDDGIKLVPYRRL